MALTELFFDTFTDTAGTLLTAHTPETGLGWTSLAGNVASNANIGSDGTAVQPFHNLTGDNFYTANTAQAETLHQRIEVIHGATAVTRVCLRLRNGSTAADGIFIEFSSAINRVKIFSVTNAVATEVAASFSALTVPTGATCIATITAANGVTASVNGTPVDWASGVTEFTVNGHDAGKFGWLGRKSYTTGGITSFKGFYDVAGVTPITFNGTIDNIVANDGDSVSIDLSTYFSGTQTPFTFANIGTALTGTGLTLSSTALLSGTATEGSSAAVQVQGTDADTNTAVSNTFSVTINAAPALPPQGTVTVGSITVGETTATVPFTYNDTDQSGFVYRLNGGAPQSVGSSPISLTGLTADTAYTIDVAATNANGTGSYSTPVSNFTTDAAAPANPQIVFTTGDELVTTTPNVVRANESGFVLDFYNVTTGALYVRVTGLTTDANGLLPAVQNAALPVAGTVVRVVGLATDGAEFITRKTTQ